MKKIICVVFLSVILFLPCGLAYAQEPVSFDYNCGLPYYGDNSAVVLFLLQNSAGAYKTEVWQVNAIVTNVNNPNSYPEIYDNVKFTFNIYETYWNWYVNVGVSSYVTFAFSSLIYNPDGTVQATIANDATGSIGGGGSFGGISGDGMLSGYRVVGYQVYGQIWDVNVYSDFKNYVTPFTINFAGSSQTSSDVNNIQIEILEELQSDEIGDIPDDNESQTTISDYATTESELLESVNSDVDVGGVIDVQINASASSSIWSTLEDFVRMNDKIFSLVITLLSVFVIALIFNR